jgi:VIT1/CCC1 family predicted Fe2+/Mn2+ transporter
LRRSFVAGTQWHAACSFDRHHAHTTSHGTLPRSRWALSASRGALDPLERACEILFGVIMVMTFTGSISVAEGAAADTRTMITGAIGCNLAWGIVDAAMYLLATFSERARGLATLRAMRLAGRDDAAHLLLDALPPVVSSVLTPGDVDTLRQRLNQLPDPEALASLNRTDFRGAAGVFLLVFLSTFPVIVPFFVVNEIGTALRASNAVALVMLFITGWSLGRYAGRPGWRVGLGVVAVGIVLVAITMLLGG